jgi:Rrf2 family nitric oxide-sensitive transcriptional repressor
MHLTRHTDYALRVLMYVGARQGQRVTITEVAEAYGISRNHLVKVVNALGHQGYLQTTRGKGGGIRLGLPPGEIGVGRVVRAMEEQLEIIDCAGSECPILGPCRLSGVLDEALEAFLAVLDRYTLAYLLGNQDQILQALGVPAPETPAEA